MGNTLRVRELQQRIHELQSARLDVRTLPTLPALGELLPGGGLRPGAVYSVAGSPTLAMALMAGPVGAGSWSGVIGIPEFGAEAAAGLGVALERVVLVPHPGEHWLAVAAAIADAIPVVVVRPAGRLSDATVARLSARLRQRDAVLIALGDWPQSEARLSVSQASWQGIGYGHGHLASRQLTVTVTGRTGYRRSGRIQVPGPEHRVDGGRQRTLDVVSVAS